MTRWFPPERIYSDAISNSSMVADIPRLSSIGVCVFPKALNKAKFCMLRAPTWNTSTYLDIISNCVIEVISTTTGMPVTWRASAISSSPSSPNPWNVYGEVRGLKTPPRRAFAPAARTAWAVSSNCSRDSTEHGPAMMAISSPPTLNPSSGKTEFLGWNCLEASLYG